MEPVSDLVVQEGPQPADGQPHSERTLANAVFGFPVAANQYSVLQSAEFQSSGQREEGLVDPRTTRHLRQAAARAGNWEKIETRGNSFAVLVENAAQGNFDSDTCVDPVAVELSSQFIPYSFSASSSDILLQSVEPVQYMLGNGAVHVNGEQKALYYTGESVKDVACMESNLKGLVMRGRIGRRGDWATGPLVLDLPHVHPHKRHA